MKFDVITLYPKAFDILNNLGVITKALEKGIVSLNLYDLRDFGVGSYRQIDDRPYGGGSGMVLKPEPIYNAHGSITQLSKRKTLLMTPQGKNLEQKDFLRWSSLDQLIIICGQFEGFDERVRCLADEEISLGDYVLSGGEIPSIAIINGVTRLLPGTLGAPESLLEESYKDNLIEYPHYTRPVSFENMKVPDILLSGNHKDIKRWRENQSQKKTNKKINHLNFEDDDHLWNH